MDLQLKDKKALVTGSTAGIGYGIARQLLKEGAHVIINGRTQERIDSAISQLENTVPQCHVSGCVADFSDKEQVNQLITAHDSVDILINNVGTFSPKAFETITYKMAV